MRIRYCRRVVESVALYLERESIHHVAISTWSYVWVEPHQEPSLHIGLR